MSLGTYPEPLCERQGRSGTHTVGWANDVNPLEDKRAKQQASIDEADPSLIRLFKFPGTLLHLWMPLQVSV